MKLGRRLTIEEANKLPVGTKVLVTTIFNSMPEIRVVDQMLKPTTTEKYLVSDKGTCPIHDMSVALIQLKIFEMPEEEIKVNKTLTTLEMIAEGLDNPNKVYKVKGKGKEAKVQSKSINGRLNEMIWVESGDECQGKPLAVNPFTMKYQWERVQEPVDFYTAMKSGKKIKHKAMKRYHATSEMLGLLSCDDLSTAINMIQSKEWYIEE